MENLRDRIRWITGTGVMLALLVTLQWATAGLGQLVTGSCVNAVLVTSTLMGGIWCGVTVAALSPVCAFLFGIGPQLIQIIPAIALGNLVYVLAVVYLGYRLGQRSWQKMLGIAISACLKFVVLYVSVVRVLVPAMGPALPVKQAETFTAMFSFPQLITALIGGAVALAMVSAIRKGIQK